MFRVFLISCGLLMVCRLPSNAVPLPSAQDYELDFDDTEIIEFPSNGIEQSHDEHIIDLRNFGELIYGEPDEQHTATLVASYNPDSMLMNPEELGSYLEGDILVPNSSEATTKNGITSQSARWPKGIVPYEIRGKFNAADRATIESAIEQYHKRTCIRFVRRTNERDYISIVSGNSGCWSSVGRIGGKQEVNLQSPGCLGRPGTAIHELMHALGFLHEQNRMERDGYVAIQYQNIQPSAKSNFEKASRTEAFGVPYDYGSVMHYSANAFSTNGKPTIVATRPEGKEKMGQRIGFSDMDVKKLNSMYKCPQESSSAPSTPAPTVPAPAPAPAVGNPIISSFLGGLISGLSG